MKFEENNDILNTNSCCENCVYGLIAFSENKKIKLKISLKGAKSCSFCQINCDFKTKNHTEINKFNITEFDIYDLKYNGIEMNCLNINTNNENNFYKKINRIRISSENKKDVVLIKFKERNKGIEKCISIHEYQNLSKDYTNSLNIYVGDEINDILKLKEKRFRLISSGDKKYLTVINDNLTFELKHDLVEKWYYHIRLN